MEEQKKGALNYKETILKKIVKSKERFEFVELKNVSRVMDRMGFKSGFDFSNLSKDEKNYAKEEVRSVKSHVVVESKQEVT